MKLVSKQITIKSVPVTILFVTIYSVIGFTKYLAMGSALQNTTMWWLISAIILIVFLFAAFYFYDTLNNKSMIPIYAYLIWNIICIIRGAFVAEIYWDWKLLVNNAMVFMLTLTSFLATNKLLVQSIFSYYVKYIVPLFLFFMLILRTDAFGFYLMPISTLLLFFPVLSKRSQIMLIGCTAIVLLADLGARSNVIKFGVPIMLLSIYYLRSIISTKLMETARLMLFIIPVFLFILGTSGIFNVFKMDEYIGKDISAMGTDPEGNRAEESLVADTRTFLYEEVLQSSINNDYWLFGRTPARGNDSNTFGLLEFEWTGRYERASNEIGLANVFTWTGLIGVILYTLVFFRSSYLAINRSNNIFIKLVGLYLAFRWAYSWIEDYQTFSLNYILLIIMWGMCLSQSFREMSDNDFTFWARGIFDKRYIKLQDLKIKKTLYEKSQSSSVTDLPQ